MRRGIPDFFAFLSDRSTEAHDEVSAVSLGNKTMMLRTASPEQAGCSSAKLQAVYRLLEDSVAARAFPGAVILIAKDGLVVGHSAFGRFTYEDTSPRMQADTLFDLASLTKVVAATTAAMILFEEGRLDLDARVAATIPEFGQEGKAPSTIRHLLTHTSGLPGWADLYRTCRGKAAFLSRICEMELEYETGTKCVYSDLGIIVLGAVLERCSGMSLDVFSQSRLFGPLRMPDTMFNPPEEIWSRIAPTEEVPERGGIVQGQVHDENAFAMGGVAPHAGLFGTAGDLAIFAQMLLNGGEYAGKRIVQKSTIALFTRRQPLVEGEHRGLGWRLWSEDGFSGRHFSPSSYGHTGFTGTSLWIDPERNLFVILLTNRVHPTRDNTQLLSLRPRIHDRIALSCD